VPALAMTAAVISLRRIRISPLGVARRAVPPKPTPRPLPGTARLPSRTPSAPPSW